MSLNLSPKALFQQQEDQVKTFRAISRNSHFQQALSSALAEFAHTGKATSEELGGVKRFIAELLNIAERDSPPQKLPVKRLDHSSMEPLPPKPVESKA